MSFLAYLSPQECKSGSRHTRPILLAVVVVDHVDFLGLWSLRFLYRRAPCRRVQYRNRLIP